MSRALKPKIASAATGAVALSYTFQGVGDLERIIVTLDAAATTSEALTVTLDAASGAGYDAAIRSHDPSVSSGTVFEWVNLGRFVVGDTITIAYTNTDAAAWSAQMYIDIQAME